MQDATHIIGVLVQVSSHGYVTAIAAGQLQFSQAQHAGGSGYEPTQVHFAPRELPEGMTEGQTVRGLEVRTSRDVRPHHIRICCYEDDPLARLSGAPHPYETGVRHA